MGFFGDLVKKALGKEPGDGSQASKDEAFASLYEACSGGTLPIIRDPPIILKRGETAHFVSPVAVIEQKTETTTYRAYAGTRLKIGKVPFYVGGSAPRKVSNEVLAPIGEGNFIVTNKRVVLSGTKINYSTRLDQITHWELFKDGIQILWEGRYGGRFYMMDDARPAVLILEVLVSGIPQQPLIVIRAAVHGWMGVVKALLQGGADADQRAEEGYTALMFISHIGDRSMAELLLEAGADVNARAEDGSTALMLAALGGQSEMVSFLIERGAEINAKTGEGATAVTAAADGGHREVVELLIAAGARDVPDDSDVSQDPEYFVGAAAEGRVDVVARLLDNGTDVNLTTKDGDTALIFAAIQGQVEVLQLLLQRGAAINKKNKDGLTALMMAASAGRAEAVKFLAERSGEINVKTKDGATPLMFAALHGHCEVVELLLRGGANPNAKNKDGGTALGAAEHGGHPEVAELLKAYGAKS